MMNDTYREDWVWQKFNVLGVHRPYRMLDYSINPLNGHGRRCTAARR